MDIAEYRLLHENVYDFKHAAAVIESEIRRYGLDHNAKGPVPGTGGRQHHDMWVSMKTVSHFNLGVALELMLKLTLKLNQVEPQHTHLLVKLYEVIPAKFQQQLDQVYQSALKNSPVGFELVAYMNSASPIPSQGPPNRVLASLKDFFVYFDEDVMLSQKRYSWELVEEKQWRHYISDISVFTELAPVS